MSDIAIKADNISKIYKLYDDPKDRMKEALHPMRKKYHHDFYALNDVSFKIKHGETVGIIGKNGSGKSTLLKIITGVLRPSHGKCHVNGKVSALLELGTGFNPELTGIENVYFSGIVTGSTKEEMDAKIYDILAFAEIGNFIHQPVKTYSSGMYVRLAFSVAINVDPDILIIDEALAVGDIRFQQKCFRKINEFREDGKTILFCSHDPAAILNFCVSCIWIDDGVVKEHGVPDEVVKKYLAWNHFESNVIAKKPKTESCQETQNKSVGLDSLWRDISNCAQFGDEAADILSVAFYDEHNGNIQTLKGGEKVNLVIKAKFNKDMSNVIFGFTIKNNLGEPVCATNTFVEKYPSLKVEKGNIKTVKFSFIMPNLGNNSYSIDVAVASGNQEYHLQHCWKYDALVFNTTNQLCKAEFGYIFINSDDIRITEIY